MTEQIPEKAGERDEILNRLSPAFLKLFDFVQEQKANQAAGATITQTAKEVKH